MAYAILRTAKLKTLGNVAGSGAHAKRSLENDPSNIDLSRSGENVSLVGGDNVLDDVKNALPEKYRSNAVLAVENLMTASPDFFIGKSKKQIEMWADDCVDFAKDFYGDENVVSAELHMDEATPHIHLYAVPKIDGKLNCREFLGGKVKLQKMQTKFANAMEKWGLERGLEGSKRKHVSVAQLNAMDADLAQKPRLFDVEVVTEKHQNFLGAEIIDKSVDVKMYQAKYAKPHMVAGQKAQALKLQNGELKKQVDQSKVFKDFSYIRSQPLAEIALKMGYEQDEKDLKKWRTPVGTVSIQDEKFMDFSADYGAGGAIDFVMHTEQIDFKNATALLSDMVGDEGWMKAAVSKKAVSDFEKNKYAKVELVPPAPSPNHENDLKTWLLDVRKIPAKIVNQWVDQGKVFAQKFGRGWQAVFKHSENAYQRVNPANNFKGWVAGSDLSKPMMVGNSASEKVAIVEGHIDAMSLQVLRPDLSVAVAGSLSGVGKTISKLKAESKKVVLALDNDVEGRKVVDNIMSKPMGEGVGVMWSENGNDWNDELIYQQQAELNQIQYNQEMQNMVDNDQGPTFK